MNANQVTVGAVLGGRYELTAAMASGGMAQVWRAVDKVLNRPVAIKVLHPHLATDDAFVSRFRREAISSARLQHSSIVAVYDTVAENGVEAIVMELIEGRTLRSILDQSTTLPPSTVVQIGIQIADALAVAHRAGTVHRDIKPANIMIDNEMRVVVTDFGIAKASRDADLTDTGTLLGTAKYLSPEQVIGENIDARTDLYALGVVMFEALTGEPPFNAETDAATALARLQGPVPRCRDRSASVPAGLDTIVARAMAQSADDRFPDALMFKEALVNADLSSPAVEDYYYPDPSIAVPAVGTAPPTQANNLGAPTPPVAASPAPTGQSVQPHRQQPPMQQPPAAPVDGTTVMSPDLVSSGPADGYPPAPATAAPPPSKKRGGLVGRGLFILLFILALLVAGLLAVAGGLIGPQGPLTVTGITSADPQGDTIEEREDRVVLAVDGDPETRWFTESYRSAGFSGLKSGVGLAVFFDGNQDIHEVTIASTTENWSAEFYLIQRDFETWSDEVRKEFDPSTAQPIGRITDHSGNATVDLDDSNGQGVLIWITDHGTSTGEDDNVRRRMVIQEVTFR